VTIKEDYDDGMFSGGPGTVYNDSQYTIIQDDTSQDSIAATPKTENPFYQCPHCDDNFDSFDDVTNHIEDEHENNETENVVKCSECRKQLPRDHDAIKQHMRTEHMPDADFILPDKKHDKMKSSDPDKKKFACAYCGDKFPSKAVRAAHEKFGHVDVEGNLLEIPCKICQEILPSSVHFRRHCIDKHKKYNYSTENNESYCCEECGKTFKKTHLLTIHKRTAHVDKTQKNFKCDLCDYTSYAKRYILDHKAKVHDEYKHVCDQCGERFRYPYYLRVHSCPSRQLRPEDLKCVRCGMEFNYQRLYVRHFLQKHKEAPPGFEGSPLYKCGHEPCEELFLTEINLQKHIKNIHEEHFKTKPAKENKGRRGGSGVPEPAYCGRCDQHFNNPRYLLLHYKAMHNEIPPEMRNRQQFPCDTCGKVFLSRMGVNNHIRYVHNKEPKGKTIRRADGSITRPVQVQVTCPHCDKTLSSLTRLKDHIKNIHETNKTYKCPSCHKAFGTMQSKRQHLKIAKSCQKKAMKIEAGGGQPRKQQRATNVIARGHAVTTNATQWHRQETHAAIASLNEIKWH